MRTASSLPRVLTVGPYTLQTRGEAHRAAIVDVLSLTDDIARWTHVPFPYGDAEFDEWLELDDSHYVILENGRLLGSVGADLSPSRTANVGYWLAPNARGRGIATLALRALCSSLFDAGYERICADVLPGNPKSEHVLERAGFRFEGVMRSVYSPRCGLGSERSDQRRFSRLATDAGDDLHKGAVEGAAQGARVANIAEALASFSELWSPRIIGNVNDYEVRVAKVEGEHLWHSHVDTDEFFMVLSGTFSISLREADGERDVLLNEGELFVVPRGIEHRPHSKEGASILMFERGGTSSVGDYEGAVPDHIDSTQGHPLESPST
ncbi:MAG: RimJ/RimL family protein N-acetyltransferase [Polyangiales bacterium]|jgi:RimJ/RimL family protein N-acetyltransferase/mannose-6-phosphate isomerase-like protein (cupin superfamily)